MEMCVDCAEMCRDCVEVCGDCMEFQGECLGKLHMGNPCSIPCSK